MNQMPVYPENIKDIRTLASDIDNKIKIAEDNIALADKSIADFIKLFDDAVINYERIYSADNEEDFDYSIFEDMFIQEYHMENIGIAHMYIRQKMMYYKNCISQYSIAKANIMKSLSTYNEIKEGCKKQIEKLS